MMVNSISECNSIYKYVIQEIMSVMYDGHALNFTYLVVWRFGNSLMSGLTIAYAHLRN